jgi:hypothetical protein
VGSLKCTHVATEREELLHPINRSGIIRNWLLTRRGEVIGRKDAGGDDEYAHHPW